MRSRAALKAPHWRAKDARRSPPGKAMSAQASNRLKRGATAFTAGCWFTARNSAVVPLYEVPRAPTAPFDQGWETIQSTTSAPSRVSSGLHG